MGKEVVYCASCGDRIPSSDFDKDKAVTAQGHHYCKNCAGGVTRVEPSPDDTPKSTHTSRPTKVRTTRMSREDKSDLRRLPTNYLIVAATIAAVAMIVLILLFLKAR